MWALNVAVSHTIIGPRETGRQLGEGAKNSDRAAARFGLNRPIKSRQSHCRRESSEDRLLFFTRRTRLPGRSAVRPSQRGSPIRERGLVPWTIWDPRIGHTTKNLTPFCHGCSNPKETHSCACHLAGRLERLGEKNKSRSCTPVAVITARTSQNGCYLRCRSRSQQGPRGLHRQGRQHQLHDGVAAPRQQVSTARRSKRSPASARSFPVVALRRRRRRSATTTGALGEAPGADRLKVYPLRYSPPGALLRDALTRARRARASIMRFRSVLSTTPRQQAIRGAALGSARSFTDSRLEIRSWPILWRASVVARGDDRRRAHRMGRPPTRVGELFSLNPYPWGLGTA